ncbi:hypothetical protein ACI2IV_13595 [Psychrobacter faecalis]
MPEYTLSETQVRLIMSCLDDKRDAVLRKTDNLRKMQGSISDSLHKDFMQVYEDELHLINSTYLAFIEK